MPIYEYKCNSCGKKFEKIEKFSDSPLETHEECGGPVERLISAPSFQFKGTGWYVTDYGKSNGGSAGTNGAESKKESSSEAKSESAGSKDSKSSESKGSDSKSSDSSSSSSSSTPATSTSSSSDKK
jgi:putative FmdB family regulatory protein